MFPFKEIPSNHPTAPALTAQRLSLLSYASIEANEQICRALHFQNVRLSRELTIASGQNCSSTACPVPLNILHSDTTYCLITIRVSTPVLRPYSPKKEVPFILCILLPPRPLTDPECTACPVPLNILHSDTTYCLITIRVSTPVLRPYSPKKEVPFILCILLPPRPLTDPECTACPVPLNILHSDTTYCLITIRVSTPVLRPYSPKKEVPFILCILLPPRPLTDPEWSVNKRPMHYE
ncbi:hypothetical protein CDAR_367831 [Caerostris darwini]|uniref:Uncharacterized protein n=1 Tax=Caerostris darwini TaxID=1538125 RepID=A0AAV4QBK7_9ARAC|nr:hypothetical protein CDAR_367831 [Caerostris darwini]